MKDQEVILAYLASQLGDEWKISGSGVVLALKQDPVTAGRRLRWAASWNNKIGICHINLNEEELVVSIAGTRNMWDDIRLMHQHQRDKIWGGYKVPISDPDCFELVVKRAHKMTAFIRTLKEQDVEKRS